MTILGKGRFGIVGLILSVVLVAGCAPKEQPEQAPVLNPSAAQPEPTAAAAGPATSPDELMAEWKKLATEGRASFATGRCREIATLLFQADPKLLKPMLDVIGDPNASGDAKSLAAYSLELFVDKDMAASLRPLVTPDHEANTRTCAAHLLAASAPNFPENVDVLRSLLNDPDRRIRLAALVGLDSVNEPEARAKLIDWYRAPDASPSEKARIIMSLSLRPVPDDIPIFRATLEDPSASSYMHFTCVQVLAFLGDTASLPAIRAAKEQETRPEIRDIIDEAVKMLESKAAAPAASSGEGPEGTASGPSSSAESAGTAQ